MKFGDRSCIIVLAGFLAVPVLGQGLKPVDRPDELGFAADRLERVTTVFQGYVDNGQLPGAVVLIARNDQVAYFECSVPGFDGAVLSREWKEALWARFCTAAPPR